MDQNSGTYHQPRCEGSRVILEGEIRFLGTRRIQGIYPLWTHLTGHQQYRNALDAKAGLGKSNPASN